MPSILEMFLFLALALTEDIDKATKVQWVDIMLVDQS